MLNSVAMLSQTRIVAPGPDERSVRTADGQILQVPEGWALLPPGDATLTRRVKAAGPTWTVQKKMGRRTFSQGVFAPANRIQSVRAELETERSTDSYAKRRAAQVARRERKQTNYIKDFQRAVLTFLDFSAVYADLAERLAAAVTLHSTPVGSGTVARTERIPIERRADSAVIAWLRHRTTAYDDLKIARVRGKRRQVRRQLAEQSRRLLETYRTGRAVEAAQCPLQRALAEVSRSGTPAPQT